MHLRRFRFPHCKTKSDDGVVVCLVASELDLSTSTPLLPDVSTLLLAVPLILLLLLVLMVSPSIRLLNITVMRNGKANPS